MITIKKVKDSRTVRSFTHKVADIPNGVSVSTTEFDGNENVLHEGTPLGIDKATGLYHPVKNGVIKQKAEASDTTYTIGNAQYFKVGDLVTLKEGSKARTIITIEPNETNPELVDLILDETLGVEAKVGSGIFQALEETDTDSVLKYEPVGLVGESYDIEPGTNLFVNVVTIGQVRESNIPELAEEVKKKLNLINFI